MNEYPVQVGYAKVTTYQSPSVKYRARFLAAEKAARDMKRGLWGK